MKGQQNSAEKVYVFLFLCTNMRVLGNRKPQLFV